MATLNVTKVREELRLNDNEDSPVYSFTLDDDGVDKLWAAAQPLFAQAQTLAPIETTDESQIRYLRNQLSEVIKEFIVLFLGQKAYDEIVAYVGDGLPAKDLNFELCTLAEYLMSRLTERVSSRMNSDVLRYLRQDNENANII